MSRGRLVVLGALAIAVAPARAAGPTPDAYLARLAELVRVRVEALVAARAPQLVPPVPRVVAWRAVKVAPLDLGAPLLAVATADLDGQPGGELYAVTTRAVVAVGFRGGAPVELGRVAFSGDPATPPSRDPVGSVVVERGALIAAASGWARELRVGWAAGKLVAAAGDVVATAGFLLCPGERAALAPGRNYFALPGGPAGAVRCRGDLVDRDGTPLRVRAELGLTGRLAVAVERCATPATCLPLPAHELARVGAAFAIADVDRDGTPEVIASDHSAPGEPDQVRVVTLGGDDKRGVFRRAFPTGVAGLATVDVDGDGEPEVVALVRAGWQRVDVWRLQ